LHDCVIWLRETEPEKKPYVREMILKIVAELPEDELLKALERGRRLVEAGLPDNEAEVRAIFAQRLAQIAQQKKDVPLAQRLLETSGHLLGDQGDPVAQLASGAANARVEPRTVGLVLSIRSEEARRRAVDIAAGVAFGLGLPGSTAKLVSRDDGGDLKN